jgi:taurine dioxygenase
MRAFCDTLRGLHRFAPPPGVDQTKEYEELMKKRILASEHPIVRVHPETGERALYVSPSFLKSIVGLTPRESQALLELLWEHVVRPEFTVRFKWEPGSVAFWDNRSTCHLAPRDIFDSDFDRQFYRVTLLGDVPVGIDGRSSTAREGEPIVAV